MDNKNNNWENIALIIALANVGFFGLMFGAMGYFELVGADTSYFDDGSNNNLKMINSVLGIFGLSIDPFADPEVNTRGYSICFGLFMVSSFVAMTIAGRKSRSHYELTDAKK